MKLYTFIIGIAILLCSGCWFQKKSDDSLTGGGSDLPEISGTVVGPNKEPKPFAQIKLISGTFNPGMEADKIDSINSVVKEITADSTGYFAFNEIDPQNYYLEILTADSLEVAIVPRLEISEDAAIVISEFSLSSVSKFKGSIHPSVNNLEILTIAGTHYNVTPVDNQFKFILPNAEDYRLVALLNQNKIPLANFSISESQSIIMDTLVVEENLLTFYDFESLDSRNSLRGIAYQSSDNVQGVWKINDISINSFPETPDTNGVYISEVDAYRGKSLNLNPDHKSSFYVASTYTDLSNMESIEFYAKGSGEIKLLFKTKAVPTGEGSFTTPRLTLLDTWQKLIFKAEDIVAPGGSITAQKGTSWSEAGKGVIIIQFDYFGSEKYMIDNIHMRGMSYLDF